MRAQASIYLSVYLPTYLLIYVPTYLPTNLSIHLSIYLSSCRCARGLEPAQSADGIIACIPRSLAA